MARMGRPAKQVNIDNAREVCNYLRGQQDSYYKLGEDNYSKDYIDALKQKKFAKIILEGIGTEYLFHSDTENLEQSVPFLQKFLDLHMSNDDKSRMWGALRKRATRKDYNFNSFQVTLDSIGESEFNSSKSDVISNIGLDTDTKFSNTDIIIGLMDFASSIKDESVKKELLDSIKIGRSFRKTDLYKKSDLYNTRRKACISAIIELGLDEIQADRFLQIIRLEAFDNKTISELLNDKADKPVPRYLAGLHKLREPKGDTYNLPRYDPKRRSYYKLENWVVLPSDDAQTEEQLDLDV
jgi:hypothetical protein